MSNPTTPFGWQMPTATDLVTDLPADFEVFGQAVATSMADLLGGTSGQILAKNSNTDMDFVWIANDQGDITGITAGTGITVTSPTGPVPTVTFDQANFGGGQFAAGKNKIINGDFKINQRGFTSNTADSSYNFDRFFQANSGGTFTSTPQTFTPGSAPVAGYEGSTFLQVITAGSSGASDYGIIRQRIESVRTFANQTVTVSFWAKAASGTPKIATEMSQNFGSGGSPSATVNTTGAAVTLSTSWARFSTTIVIPSISGKTLGTTNDGYLELNLWLNAGSTFNTRASSIGNQNATFQIWGVQVEAGSVATPFQTASGSIQGELALCKYYYSRYTSGNVYGVLSTGIASNTGTLQVMFPFPTGMRVIPTAVDTSAMATFYFEGGASNGNTPTTVTIGTNSSVTTGHLLVNKAAAFVSGMPYSLNGNNSSTAFIGFSAEL